jgi:hypothetical protein
LRKEKKGKTYEKRKREMTHTKRKEKQDIHKEKRETRHTQRRKRDIKKRCPKRRK